MFNKLLNNVSKHTKLTKGLLLLIFFIIVVTVFKKSREFLRAPAIIAERAAAMRASAEKVPVHSSVRGSPKVSKSTMDAAIAEQIQKNKDRARFAKAAPAGGAIDFDFDNLPGATAPPRSALSKPAIGSPLMVKQDLICSRKWISTDKKTKIKQIGLRCRPGSW